MKLDYMSRNVDQETPREDIKWYKTTEYKF